MFRLPVCPHCKTVYSYKEVKENNKKKTIKCYHCNKNFRNERKGIIALMIAVCFFAALINVIVLYNSSGDSIPIVPMFIISVIAIVIGLILVPFFISYKKIK